MTAVPTTFAEKAALAEPSATATPSIAARLLRGLALFRLCRQIAAYSDTGRAPPPHLLEELGIRNRD